MSKMTVVVMVEMAVVMMMAVMVIMIITHKSVKTTSILTLCEIIPYDAMVLPILVQVKIVILFLVC